MNNINYKFNNKRGTSNKIVAILVIVSLLVTIIGTWTVLGQIGKIKQEMRTNTPQYDSGKVRMTITPANAPNAAGEIKLNVQAS